MTCSTSDGELVGSGVSGGDVGASVGGAIKGSCGHQKNFLAQHHTCSQSRPFSMTETTNVIA